MGCNTCKQKSCNGCENNSIGNLQNQLADLQQTVENLLDNAKFLLCGHPILILDNVSDIEQFDISTGKGIGCWDKWAICDGKTHINPKTKKPFVTPNFTDRFIVQAGGNYEVGDTGGSDTVTLTIPQLPAHNHGVTDAGHIHQINDPGHIHAIDDDMHTHQVVNEPHNHAATLEVQSHTHGYTDTYQNDNTVTASTSTDPFVQFYSQTPGPGQITLASSSELELDETTDGSSAHNAVGYTDMASVVITTDPAATGIEVLTNETGIDQTENAATGITINNEGGDEAHENRPPYHASLYVIKVW